MSNLFYRRVMSLALVPFLFFAVSSAQQRDIEPVRLEKIGDGLYQILGGRGANGGLSIGDNGVLVIDAKMTRECVAQTLAAIKEITELPVKYLVNTHSDGDHITGNRFFPKDVTIIAHENCRREFFHPRRDGEPSEWNDPQSAPFLPELTYSQMMTIHLGDKKAELWYFGAGHTTGDTVVYFPEEKTAFLGDQIFTGRPQLIHAYKGGDSFEHVKTLSEMLRTLDAEVFCSGHSEPVDRKIIQQHIWDMKELQNKITEMAGKGMSLEEIQSQFEENQARLVEVIFNEVKNSGRLIP